MKIRGLFKKAAATLMAAVTALSILPATTAFAAGDIGTISFSHTYDSSGNAMRYNSSATFDGHTAGGTGNYKYRMFVDGENAFCIQPGVPLNTGNTLKKASSDTWNALSANQKKAVGLALLYGYQGNRSNLTGKFCAMTLRGIKYTEKAAAGEMLLAICKEYPLSTPTEIGSYRGFKMEVFYDTVNAHYCLNLCGKAKYKVDLGFDPLGNLTRIENELAKLPARLEAAKTKRTETIAQFETAKVEVQKPFAFEGELKEKSERLNALNIELNLDKKDPAVLDAEPEQSEEQPERKCENRER